LHDTLRNRLFDGLAARAGGSSLVLTGKRGELNDAEDLEAPLAVQSASPRAGFFPFNKYSAGPLLVRATRLAESEAEQSGRGDPDAIARRKRFMVVPNCHVIRIERQGTTIVRVVTNQGTIDVPTNGQVFLAAGTIESTRLALQALPNAHGL